MLARYIGKCGTNGFKNGNVYKLKYEFVGGILLLITPRGTLQFACENERIWKKNFKRMEENK